MIESKDQPPDEPKSIREVIDQFLQERLQPKLDKIDSALEKATEDEKRFDLLEKRQDLLRAHRPETWIPDAAKRVTQIQQVTHAIKYTHPDAKGTSLSSQGNPAAGDALVGTHTLGSAGEPDVVGNAAALDVLKFLRLEVDGKSLLARAAEADPALAAALSGNIEQAQSLMTAFAGLTDPKGDPATHKLAKQLYWPLEDGGYHLLAPLFPTTLVHRLWATMREDRFSDEAKAARDAHYNKRPHEHGYHEYPQFAIINFGGTKPQNISQLNSQRYGEAWLLASVPPTWRMQPAKPPLNVETVFERRFGYRRRVRELTRGLREFLDKLGDWNNLNIRNKRAALVGMIRDELIQFAAEVQELPAGWSAEPECLLNREECLWLDPGRAATDQEFAAERLRGDWQERVSRRFGNWLNARLSVSKTPMGDAEHQAWQDSLETELRTLREELDSHV